MRKLLNLLGSAVKSLSKCLLTTAAVVAITVAPLSSAQNNVHAYTTAATTAIAVAGDNNVNQSLDDFSDTYLIRPRDSFELLEDTFKRKEEAKLLVAPGFRVPKGAGNRNYSKSEWFSLSSNDRKNILCNGGMLNLTSIARDNIEKLISHSMGGIILHLLWSVPLFATVMGFAATVRTVATVAYYNLIALNWFLRGVFTKEAIVVTCATMLIGCNNETYLQADAGSLIAAIAASSVFSNLGKLVTNVERKRKNIPKTKLTIVKGSEDAPKITLKASTADCLGLDMFGHHLGLDQLGERDILFLEANGVSQNQIKKVVLDTLLPFKKRVSKMFSEDTPAANILPA